MQPHPHGQQPPQQYQQVPRQPYQYDPHAQQYQQPYPYAQQYPQQYPQWWGVPVGEPSGITTLVAAVLGLLIGLAWIVGVSALIINAPEAEVGGMSVAAGITFVLSVPSLIGAIALFVRRGFGRWLLIVGLALSLLPSGFVVVASFTMSSAPPQGLVLFATSVLVFSIAGIVLLSSPTTGRYLRAVKQYAGQPGHPAQRAYPQYAQQAYAQQGYQQPQYPQQPY